jgi:hypothetical protein
MTYDFLHPNCKAISGRGTGYNYTFSGYIYTFWGYNYTLLYPFIPENKTHKISPQCISATYKKLNVAKQAYPGNYTFFTLSCKKK